MPKDWTSSDETKEDLAKRLGEEIAELQAKIYKPVMQADSRARGKKVRLESNA